jgi:hypothetical protein
VIAEQQLRASLDAKAEGMSILNYGLANKQFVDALSVGKLLGVDTSRLRPYGGESTNTVNVIGTDAMDSLARRVSDAEREAAEARHQAQLAQQAQQQQTPASTDGQQRTNGNSRGNLLRNIAIGTGLVLSGVSIPLIADKIINRDNGQQVTPVDGKDGKDGKSSVVVPWNNKGPGKVEVDVY